MGTRPMTNLSRREFLALAFTAVAAGAVPVGWPRETAARKFLAADQFFIYAMDSYERLWKCGPEGWEKICPLPPPPSP